MPCWLWLQVCQRKERSCKDVITHVCRAGNAAARTLLSHPTPPRHLETMPLSPPTPPHPTVKTMHLLVWPQVCQRKERSCKDVIVPPHPNPPHTPHPMPHSVTARIEEGTQLQGRCSPTPPHPTASGDDAMLSVAAHVPKVNAAVRMVLSPPIPSPRTWRRCHAECSSTDLGCKVTRILVSESRGFWLRNRRFLVAESSVFGCGSAFFWLRKRI